MRVELVAAVSAAVDAPAEFASEVLDRFVGMSGGEASSSGRLRDATLEFGWCSVLLVRSSQVTQVATASPGPTN